MVEINTCRQRVVESLTAAEVPEVLATGIADILAGAGFKLLASSSGHADNAARTLVTPVKPSLTSIPRFLRLFPVVETLPTLVLKYDQRIGLPAQKRRHKMYRNARLAAENHQADVLMLTPYDRVA
jgi:hypothetical protein